MSITWVGKILVIKDTRAELDVVSSYLENQGYQIITAHTATEALEIALEVKPNTIITNVVMPGRSGFEVCRFLKNHLHNPRVSIMVCSEQNQEIHRIWAKKQGADAYFTTPFAVEDLLMAIQSVGG